MTEVATRKQMELIPSETFPKNIALANPFGLSNPTLRKQNCLHALQYAVREQFMLRNPIYNESNIDTVTEDFIEKSSVVFDVPEEQIMANLGYIDKTKYYSLTQVLELFEEIANESIGFDSYGIAKTRDERDQWTGFTKIIGSVERKNGCFRFNVPPKMVYRIVNPKESFTANVDWQGFNSKYSPSIFESCMYFYQRGDKYTDWVDVSLFRTVSGATYTNYSKLKDRVINKALDNINNEESLGLYVELEETYMESADENKKRTTGRKPITHIRFKIERKLGALHRKNRVKSEITFASQKTELKSLGIASNQIDYVLNEIRDEHGDLILPYLSWCIRRGHELMSFSQHNKKDLNLFGGFFREKVVRACKEDWVKTNSLLHQYVNQYGDGSVTLTDIEFNKQISEVRERIKEGIAEQYIRELSEKAFVFFKEEFIKFLAREIPSAHESYLNNEFGNALTELDSHGKYYLNLYLDHEMGLFTCAAYEEFLSNPDRVFGKPKTNH